MALVSLQHTIIPAMFCTTIIIQWFSVRGKLGWCKNWINQPTISQHKNCFLLWQNDKWWLFWYGLLNTELAHLGKVTKTTRTSGTSVVNCWPILKFLHTRFCGHPPLNMVAKCLSPTKNGQKLEWPPWKKYDLDLFVQFLGVLLSICSWPP